MNSASTHHADTKAGRFARGAVRAALACALIQTAILGMGMSAPAYAQQHDRRDDQGYPQERHERFQLPPQDRDQRMAEMRALEEQRRAQQQYQQQQYQQQQQGRDRGASRLTPDERRDLRRQINEANMDLYPQRR